MKLEINHHHHHGIPATTVMLWMIQLRRELQMLSPEVQKALDLARKNNDLVKSVHIRQGAMASQIADLIAKIASLPVGNVLSDEDKAGLAELASDMAESNDTLTADVAANTSAAGSIDPHGNPASGIVNPGTGISGSTAAAGGVGDPNAPAVPPPNSPPPGPSDADIAAANADAKGAVKPPDPLPGTGQS